MGHPSCDADICRPAPPSSGRENLATIYPAKSSPKRGSRSAPWWIAGVRAAAITRREYLKHITSFRGFRVYDLAKLIGVDTTMPADLVQGMWDKLGPSTEEWRQMGLFGPAVKVPRKMHRCKTSCWGSPAGIRAVDRGRKAAMVPTSVSGRVARRG